MCSRCPFFKHACSGGLREAGTDVVDLGEDDIDALGCVIECMRVLTNRIATHLALDLYQANYTVERYYVYQSFMSAVEDRPLEFPIRTLGHGANDLSATDGYCMPPPQRAKTTRRTR
jgi:hypothetical protein